MASIIINSISLSCTPEEQFNTIIEYRVSGGGSYTSAGTQLTNTDGTFTSPFSINDLAEDTCYDIRFTITTLPQTVCPYVEGFCTGSGTTTTTTSTTTTTTSTTTTTTSTTTTTTQSFCMTQGFPAGNVYGALYWADSYTDTSSSDFCQGDEYFLPSESRAVWIVFYSNSSLTTPVVTTLNNFPVVVNGSPVYIGDGTPQYGYFVGVYPYMFTVVDEPFCNTETNYYPLPTLQSSTCFSLPPVLTEVPSPSSGVIQRASGDGADYGFYFGFPESIFEAGQVTGGTLGAAIGAGSPGPQFNTGLPVYGNVTIGADTFWGGVLKTATVVIQGTANDGSSGETISGISGVGGGTVVSSKRYLVDANHPITITIDIIP